jgi:ribokinase
MYPGGKGANQAVQAARLDADVFLVGCVGHDFLGDRLIASLRESGVHTEFVRRDASATTAACCIHVDREGHNTIVIVPEANQACSPADVDAAVAVIRTADMVLCQLEIPLPTVACAAETAAARSIPFLLNPAPGQPLPDGLLMKTTLITPNEIEAEILTGLPASLPDGTAQAGWEAAAAKELLRRGVGQVVITLGERGAFAAAAGLQQRVGGHRVAVVDATAAGDAFSGALAVALAEGRELSEALAFANAAGALATTRPGAQPSLATRQEVEQFLTAQRTV